MSKSAFIQNPQNQSLSTTSSMNYRIKPLKKVALAYKEYSKDDNRQKRFNYLQLKKYQVKNPKWASLYHDASIDPNYGILKRLKRCKSLQLTSIVFDGRQIGTCVGHFCADIKHLEKNTRNLKKLQFGAGVFGKTRFCDLKRYLLRRKSLRDLLLVPYWFQAQRKDEIEDWYFDGYRVDGMPRLIQLMQRQLEKFGIFGIAWKDVISRLNFNRMDRLKHFTLKAAFRREGCDGQSDEFGDAHLELLKKVLKLENVSILTLYCECDMTPKEFWDSLRKLIVARKGSLVVDVRIDFRDMYAITNEWFKKIFKKLPRRIKVNYSILDTSYFLSMPKKIEILGEDDGFSWSDHEDEEYEIY